MRILALLLAAFALNAQTTKFSVITASHIQDVSGAPLASGKICAQGVYPSTGAPLNFHAGAGGIVATTQVCAIVTNGVIIGTLRVPDSNFTAPLNVAYTLTVTDVAHNGGLVIKAGPTQITGDTWSLDDYQPFINPPLALVNQGVPGPPGPAGGGASTPATSNVLVGTGVANGVKAGSPDVDYLLPNLSSVVGAIGFTPQNAAAANTHNDALGAAAAAQSAAVTAANAAASSMIAALNLGTASTHPATDFDAAGAATSAETEAIIAAAARSDDASNLTSGTIPAARVPVLNQNTTGKAATSDALAATPVLCPTGQAPRGVLPNGNATGCAVAGTTPSAGTIGQVQVAGASGTFAAVPAVVSSLSNDVGYQTSPQVQSAITALSLGTASTHPATDFDASGAAAAAQSAAIAAAAAGNSATASALAATPSQAPFGQFCTGITASGACNPSLVDYSQLGGVNPAAAGAALGATSLQPTGDGSGLTGITSVQIGGLGTAATQPSTAFDVSGAATTAQSTAQAFTTSSISALGLDTASTKAAVTSLATPGVDTNVPTEKATRTAIAAAQAAAIAAAAAGNAATASALAATPSLCSTGQSPTGVLPNGNATGCATAGGASSPATLSLYKGNNSVNGIVAAVPNTDYLPVASPTMTGAPTINGNKIAAVRVATLPTSCVAGTDGAVVFVTGSIDAIYACDNTGHYAIPPGGSTTVLAGDAAGAGGSNKVLTTNGVSFGNLATQSAPASGLVGSNGTALGAATGAQINTALGFTPQNAATANANNDALGAATTAQTAAIAASAQKSANLSDLASATTARTNLGLGTAATQPSTAFDTSGAATTAQAASAQKSANGSDFVSVAAVRTNLGLGTIATLAAPSGTVVGTTDTQTLTGKTFNTGAIGNNLQIAGLGITSTSGNVGKVATASGALTSGNMPKFDGFGNVIDSGVPASAFSTNGVSNSIVTYSGPTAFSGTQFLPLAGGSSFSATESDVQSASPTAAAVTNMQVKVSVAPGAGNSIAFTWRKAGVSQTLTCTISGASATSCSDLTHSFNAAQGDLLDVQMVTTGTIPSSPFLVVSTQYGTGGSALQVPGAGGIVKSISSGAGTAVATPDTDFQSAIVVNPIASYGCVADGVSDDTACLVNMHNALFAIQAADTTNTVSFIIQSPAGKHYTYTNNRFLWGLRHVRLDWNGSSLQCLNTDGQNIDEYPLNQNRDSFSTEIFAHFPFTVSALNYGYLIQTANPGDTSVTTITPADSANFTVGRWVLVDSYDQEFGGYPPNARYFDYAKVTAINTSTGLITLDRGVTALHSSDYPEFITTPANGTGRARIVNIDRSDVPFCESLELNNIVFRPNPVLAVATTQYTLIANTYQATINGGSIQSFVPTMSHDVVVSHATIAQSEPDKLLDHVRYDSVTMGDALGGSGAKSIEVAGGSIAGPVFFNPRLLQLTGVRLNGPTNNSVAGNSSVFGSNIFLTPNRTEMRSNIFNGKNHYGDVVVAQPQSLPLTVDGITVTITNNYTVSGLMSNGAVQNFLGCAEVGSIVNVVAPTPLTTPITGIVQAIHGGTGAPQIDILFSGTVGANYVINCTAMQSLLLQSNKYYNFVNGSNGVAFNTNIVTPWVPNLNWENNVTGGGTKQVWKFNTFYGGGQLLNIYGYITKITVNVLKPYSGATASPGLTINKLTSSTGGTFSEAVNLATAGVREFSVGYYSGAVTGDIPTALTSNLYEQVIQLIINGKTQLAGTQDQQAIYTVTIETSNPFAEYY